MKQMRPITTLYKDTEGQKLKLIGHFTKEEIRAYIAEGYRKGKREQVNFNKNGIPVAG